MFAPKAPLFALAALSACAGDSVLAISDDVTELQVDELTAFVKPTPSSVTLSPGETAEVTIRLGTERGPWALAVANLPAGVTGAFAEETVAGGGSTTLTLEAAADAPGAAVFALVKARSANRTLNGGVRVTVAAPEPSDDAGVEPVPDAGWWTDDTPRHGPPFRVLFDGAHKQTEGNAYWILDAQAPAPSPERPSHETDWSGGISAWGFELVSSGRYQVAQLPQGTALNYGRGGPGDLSAYDVFVSVEPEAVFAAGEADALLQFSRRGRGILFVSDHSGAARCSRCTEAWQVINGFLRGPAQDAFQVKVDGNTVGRSGLTGTIVPSAPWGAAFSRGPFGAANSLAFFAGSSVSVLPGSRVAQLIVSSTAGGMLVAAAPPGYGRLVLVGDSSTADDGTCACRAQLYRGWSAATNRSTLLNATAWLARDGS